MWKLFLIHLITYETSGVNHINIINFAKFEFSSSHRIHTFNIIQLILDLIQVLSDGNKHGNLSFLGSRKKNWKMDKKSRWKISKRYKLDDSRVWVKFNFQIFFTSFFFIQCYAKKFFSWVDEIHSKNWFFFLWISNMKSKAAFVQNSHFYFFKLSLWMRNETFSQWVLASFFFSLKSITLSTSFAYTFHISLTTPEIYQKSNPK